MLTNKNAIVNNNEALGDLVGAVGWRRAKSADLGQTAACFAFRAFETANRAAAV
jgi:hypothetical protein